MQQTEWPHREVSCCAVLILEDLNPLVALCHAQEVAPDVGLTLLQNNNTNCMDEVSQDTTWTMSIKTLYSPPGDNLSFFCPSGCEV